MRIGSISGVGQSLFSDTFNAATQPSISFSGDTNTGIYQITADTIGFATAGAERLRIANSGLLSVATANYDTLVLSDSHIPNKKYVDDAITSGAALALNDLTNVVDTSTAVDQFLVSTGALSWVTQNAAGQRTSMGMDAGGAGDIWVEKGGDTMDSTANIVFTGGGEPLGLPAVPTQSTAAASKAYVDAQSGGVIWKGPVWYVDLVRDDVGDANPGVTLVRDLQTPANDTGEIASAEDSDMYVVGASSSSISLTAVGVDGASVTVGPLAPGTVVRFDGDLNNGSVDPTWQDKGHITTYFDEATQGAHSSPQTRWGITTVTSVAAGGTFVGLDDLFVGLVNSGTSSGYDSLWGVDYANASSNFETTSVTTVADVAGNLGGKHFSIYAAVGNGGTFDSQFYVWYNTGSSTDPTPGGTGIEVAITSGDDAATVAAKTETAVNAFWGGSLWTLSRITDNIVFTCLHYGNVTDATAGTSGFTVTVTQAGSLVATPNESDAFYVSNPDSFNFGKQFVYVAGTTNNWVEFGASATISAGAGLSQTGNVFNVNFGAGIKQSPVDEVGLDIGSDVGLIISTDGAPSTPSTDTTAKLRVLLNGSTLALGASGINVADNGITATQIATSVAGDGLDGGAGTALSVNVTASGGIVVDTDALRVDVGSMTAVTTVALADELISDQGTGTNNKMSLTQMVNGLNIPNNISAAGIVVRTGSNTYTSRTLAASATASEEGIIVNNGDGVSTAPTIGLDIQGMSGTSANITATDLLAVYDGTNNIPMTGQDLADGLSTLLTLDNTKIVDGAGTTWIDTDASSGSGAAANTITARVAAVGTFAANNSLALSSASTNITSSAGIAATNAGAPINITAGSGHATSGDGGKISITGSAGVAASYSAGGVTLSGGAGSTTANGAGVALLGSNGLSGGSLFMTAGNPLAGGGSVGSIILDSGNGGAYSVGGRINLTAGDSSGFTGGGINLVSGNSTLLAGGGGDVFLNGGDNATVGGTGGDIILEVGSGETGDGTKHGVIKLSGGDASTPAEMRFYESNVLTGQYIGFKAPGTADDTVYTLPIAPTTGGFVLASTTGGVMSWVDPVSAGSFAFGTITTDSGSVSADSGGDTVAMVGATNGGIITTGADAGTDTVTFAVDLNDLAVGSATVLALTDIIGVYDSTSATRKYTFTDMVEDLQIPNTVGATAGFVTKTGANAYATHTFTAEGAGNLDGLSVSAGGVSGTADVTIGLDILGAVAAADNLAADDLFMVYDLSATSNRKMTGQEVADGLNSLLSIDTTKITDGGTGVAETFVKTATGVDTIASQVAAGSTNALGTPLTMSADGGSLITSSAGLSGAAGGIISLTSGAGEGSGAGGAVSLSGGVGGVTGVGGAITLTGGVGGTTSGASGAVTISGGAGTVGVGGDATIQGGAAGSGAGAGSVNVLGGASAVATQSGGNAVITGGVGNTTGAGGNVLITSGDGGASGNAGNIDLTAANGGATSGNAGSINLITNAVENSGTGGFVAIKGGADGFVPSFRYMEDSANGTNYIGMQAPAAITNTVTYTLPEAPGTDGFILSSLTDGTMSWVDAASAGADSYGAITADVNGTTAGSAGATLSLLDATNGGIATVGDSASPGTITFAMDIGDLASGSSNLLILADEIGVNDGGSTLRYTFTDMVEDLKIPNGIGTSAGWVVSDGSDVYATRTVQASILEDEFGIIINSGNGSVNLAIGLDIVGLTDGAAALATTDEFPVHDKSEGTGGANRKMTGQNIADGVKTILSLDNTIITDADGTFIDTAATASTITSGVKAAGTFAAGTPLTLSAASTAITSSDGTGTANDGAPITITAGTSTTTGTGGGVTVSGGAADVTGAGGTVTIASGDGGATSGNGGDIIVNAGDYTGTGVGGDITITGGKSDTTKGGDVGLYGGDGVGVDGGDVIIAPGASDSAAGGSIVLNPCAGTTDGTISIPGPTSTTSTEIRFLEASANGTNYVGFRAPASLAANTSFIWPAADGSANQMLTTDGSSVLSFANVGAGLTAGDGISISTNTVALDINGLVAETSIAVEDFLPFWDITATASNQKITVQNFINTLDIVTATANGILTRTAGDTYASRTIVASTVAGDQGVSLVDGNGVSGNPTIGLDIVGLSAEGGTLSPTDTFPMYDGTNNVKAALSDIGAGLTLGSLGGVVETSTSAGDILVNDGTNYLNEKIQFVGSFTSRTSLTVTHNLGQQYVTVQVFVGGVQVIPATVTLTSSTVTDITFAVATAGHVVVTGVPGVGVTVIA